MGDDKRLTDALADVLRDEQRQPSPEQVAALRAQVTRQFAPSPDADPTGHDAHARTVEATATVGSRRRYAVPITLAAAAALVALLVFVLRPPTGTVEFNDRITSAAGGPTAEVSVRALPFGRVVDLSSNDLPVLPTGQYYELWFVGPDDAPGMPERISAGTWHPDGAGVSEVQFHAAVDPRQYPTIAVTAEPGDGDPRATGTEVLRSDIIDRSGNG